jgi:PIN domain nuclease of toxin-antitoxin system
MRLLLDTNTIIFAAIGDLPKDAIKLIEDPHNQIYFSSLSIWEIVIKREAQPKRFNPDPYLIYTGMIEEGYHEVPITTSQVLKVSALSSLHKDPFDRLLIAQAINEHMTILTADTGIAEYPGVSVILFKKRG